MEIKKTNTTFANQPIWIETDADCMTAFFDDYMDILKKEAFGNGKTKRQEEEPELDLLAE